MNFENRIENFAITILNHRIKVVFSAIILIILISSGIRFLETPSGYRGFVQDDFKYYQDILELEEKYGNIDETDFTHQFKEDSQITIKIAKYF